MSGPSNPSSIWSIKPKKKLPASTSAAGSASSSRRPYPPKHENIKDEDDGEVEDEDLQDVFGVGPKAVETKRNLDKLIERRKKKALRGGLRDQSPRTVVSLRNTRPVPKVSRSDRVALVSSYELIQRTLKTLTSYHGQTDEEYHQTIAKLRSCVQLLPFQAADVDSVRSSQIRKALGQLASEETRALGLPIDIVLDSQSLLRKWGNQDFDTAVLRGIDLSQTIKRGVGGGKRNTKRNTHYRLEDGYPFKKDPQVPGHNGLTIGDWWPLQICALRDGAHGEMEAGISGNKEHGCLSVIVSNGYSQDRDEGDRVFYCGTLGTLTPSDEPFNPEERVTSPGVASANTNLLLTSMEKETPIRLLRSHKGRSEYAPSDGIRYDGLYKVKAYEILDVAYAMHRFTLEREPGQPEIRYRGPGARPNDVELGERGWGGVKNTMKGERH